jgi:ubiquinone/menaquinone biosynthesis C-methylase UbiE
MSDPVYDNIASLYKDSKQLDFRKYIEEYTLLKLVGDVKNKNLLDLACGEGIYTRKLKKLGAAIILGVDISSEMIRLAKEEETKEPLGCEYLVQDILTMEVSFQFDIAVGMYLLNYARTKAELLQMCTIIYKNLEKGGRFIGFNDNPMNMLKNYGSYAKYGFIKESTETRAEGDFIRYIISNADGSTFSFNNYYLSSKTYEECFTKAGFVNFKWEGPYLEESMQGNPHWDDFFADSPLIGFSAEK